MRSINTHYWHPATLARTANSNGWTVWRCWHWPPTQSGSNGGDGNLVDFRKYQLNLNFPHIKVVSYRIHLLRQSP